MCAYIYVCVPQSVPFCPTPSTANSSERPTDRCSTRADLHVCLMSFSLVSLFPVFVCFFFFLSSPSLLGRKLGWFHKLDTLQRPINVCWERERRLPSFPRKKVAVVRLSLLSPCSYLDRLWSQFIDVYQTHALVFQEHLLQRVCPHSQRQQKIVFTVFSTVKLLSHDKKFPLCQA